MAALADVSQSSMKEWLAVLLPLSPPPSLPPLQAHEGRKKKWLASLLCLIRGTALFSSAPGWGYFSREKMPQERPTTEIARRHGYTEASARNSTICLANAPFVIIWYTGTHIEFLKSLRSRGAKATSSAPLAALEAPV